jgi:hypothetical protein
MISREIPRQRIHEAIHILLMLSSHYQVIAIAIPTRMRHISRLRIVTPEKDNELPFHHQHQSMLFLMI